MTTSNTFSSTFKSIVKLLRWDKPEGRLILMIPALWSLLLAAKSLWQLPPLDLLGVIVLGSLATSAAGCVVNDLWDRDIDPLVERTKHRPLADRSLSVKLGIGVLIVATLCAFFAAAYLNPLSFGLAVAAVPVIAIYPACKRIFPVPQLVLSIAWGFAVLIPWAAMTGYLNQNTWILWAATLAWTMGFDTVYALSDRPDDLKIGIKSSAIFFGKFTPQAIGLFFLLTDSLLIWLGISMNLGYFYFGCVAIALGIWIWQYLKISAPAPESSIYQSIFKQNVAIGFLVLLGMFSSEIRNLSIW
ncbi:4-hydroxybenzoate solanesyltransferase [Synechococcus sp. PCC 7502]|uniref:4-hydroxybenzoate solanesyltransferase n=1 Tax=Synechococcus sp. PCC 7502 TaxID=1173263 RepID=UPI00029F877F|nr:4-hydroxybenzoate solanesyltransferase [Synechococcus sp. PCC 7502]AFY72999.1 4-hydroxybenzoate solanesyltransferase [Synechococcus sp. PCC 7502]